MPASASHSLGALVLPVLIALVGTYFVADHARFAVRAERATGHVVGAGSYAGTPMRGQRRLEVEFAAAGQPHRFHARTGWKNTVGVDVGSAVEVAYDPADPSRAMLASWWRPLALPLLALGVGGWMTAALVAERRRGA